MHLGEGLLQMLDVPRGIGQQRGPLPSIAPQHDDLILGAETGREEAVGVQALEPLAIVHVAFGPAVAGHRARIDQQHLEAACFKSLEQRDPVDARGCEGDGGDVAGPEPVGQRVEIGGVRTEAADGLGVITGRDRGPVLSAPTAMPAAWRFTVASWGGKASDFFRVRGAMAASKIGW